MYLTEYREQTLKDIITKLEPELFKKVTGLSVETFDALCEIGLFDPEKMNQGIFGFRRYESSSLNYAGIDKHEGEDVGGWDTVLRRQEFDELYANQQATMSLQSAIMSAFNATNDAEVVTKTDSKQKSTTKAEKTSTVTLVTKPEEVKLPSVNVGDKVRHKAFGIGTVCFMDKAQKKIRVRFGIGEKMFVYPNAFIDGFLQLKE